MSSGSLYADVLLPLPLPATFTYSVPEELSKDVQPGCRVVVQFGQRKVHTALVRRVHGNKPEAYAAKSILSVLDRFPIVNQRQFELWDWIAEYYMCFPGEVMNAALPAGLKLASESVVCLNESATIDPDQLNEKELVVMESLQARKKLSISEISGLVDLKKIIPLIHNLMEKGLVFTEEALETKYKPLLESYVRLAQPYRDDEDSLREVFDELSRKAFKQLELMLSFINLTREKKSKFREIRKAELLKSIEAPAAILNALIKKGILELFDQETSRLESSKAVTDAGSIILSEHQKRAYNFLVERMKEKEVMLVHGITSSGKTEVYIKLIDETIRSGKQVLYLLPEIALTSQIINRLRKYFGEKVGVYHSHYNDNERAEVWYNTLGGEGKPAGNSFSIILGARSALFLPLAILAW
jgi:primosomal protein N' (replication factor Y) (superfamily II helicase)